MIYSKNSMFHIESECDAEFDSEGDVEIMSGDTGRLLDDLVFAYENDREIYGSSGDWYEVSKVIAKLRGK